MQIGDQTKQDESVQLPVPFITNFTRDKSVASGTQGVTGIGFRPSAVLFVALVNGADEFSVGMDNGLGADVGYADNNGSLAGTYSQVGNGSIEMRESGANIYSGEISSFDVDGFTVTWTRAGAPTGLIRIYFMAFK